MGVISVHSNYKHSQSYNMSSPAVVSPAKKIAKKAKTPAVHPTWAVMIGESIKAMKDRSGSSRQAILKYICANYKVDAAKAAVHVRTALKKGVAAGAFKKGAGCYKLGDKAKEEKKPKAAKVKKPVAKKPKAVKKPAAKKPKKAEGEKAATKKSAAKKPAAKKAGIKQPAAAKKSPTKKVAAKKPTTKKPVAKASPTKTAAKKPAAKKAAASKKPAAKKTAKK